MTLAGSLIPVTPLMYVNLSLLNQGGCPDHRVSMNVSVGSISGTVTVPAGVDPQRVSASLISDAGILLRSVMLSRCWKHTVPEQPGLYKMRFESYDDNAAPLGGKTPLILTSQDG